eukprot:GHVO01046626.1.p1 GENE.GHVO01046626.1~~GHVO01046626.1.p1  ORF type:complete len:258 (-),score=43.35 GHVO01046626.1:160-933(-)
MKRERDFQNYCGWPAEVFKVDKGQKIECAFHCSPARMIESLDKLQTLAYRISLNDDVTIKYGKAPPSGGEGDLNEILKSLKSLKSEGNAIVHEFELESMLWYGGYTYEKNMSESDFLVHWAQHRMPQLKGTEMPKCGSYEGRLEESKNLLVKIMEKDPNSTLKLFLENRANKIDASVFLSATELKGDTKIRKNANTIKRIQKGFASGWSNEKKNEKQNEKKNEKKNETAVLSVVAPLRWRVKEKVSEIPASSGATPM